MPEPLTCAKCGQEVRYGVRDGVTAWWHRGAVDHLTVLGAWVPEFLRPPWTPVDRPDEVAEEIPAPEIRSTPIDIDGLKAWMGPRTMLRKAREAGWEAWMTYARGPVTHGTTGALMRVSDSLVLRARRDGRIGVGFWQTDAKGKMSFEGGYVGRLDADTRKINIEAVKSADLKAFFTEEAS